MEAMKGTVEKLHIINMANSPLVYFKLSGKNCLIARHSLNFLADVTEGSKLLIYGVLNSRGQFICHKYSVLGKPQIVVEFEKSIYPSKKS